MHPDILGLLLTPSCSNDRREIIVHPPTPPPPENDLTLCVGSAVLEDNTEHLHCEQAALILAAGVALFCSKVRALDPGHCASGQCPKYAPAGRRHDAYTDWGLGFARRTRAPQTFFLSLSLCIVFFFFPFLCAPSNQD